MTNLSEIGALISVWEIYVNDDGVVSCHDVRCSCDQTEPLFVAIGRHTVFGEMENHLADHIAAHRKVGA